MQLSSYKTNKPIPEGVQKVIRKIITRHLYKFKDIDTFRMGILKLADATAYKGKYHKIPVTDILPVMDAMVKETKNAHNPA